MHFKNLLYIFSMLLLSGALTVFPEEGKIMETAAAPQGMRGVPINLPDISVIGVMNGYSSDDEDDEDKNKFEIDEIETAFQGFIYPEMKADVFLALHRHDGEYEAEICEAKASFLRLVDGLSAEAGKIHIDFGKLNSIHTHHRPMIDQPPVITNFFGDHGLVGQGGVFQYLFPIPFFLQLEIGAWNVSGHHHHHDDETVQTTSITDINGDIIEVALYEEEECSEFSLADKVYTSRLKSSFAPTAKSELEIGTSLAKGKGAHFEEHMDNAEVYGVDLTFRAWPTAWEKWTFQNEWFHLKREVPVGTLNRNGGYSFLNYRMDKYRDFGIRYDYAENAMPIEIVEKAVSLIGNYHLTETSAMSIQLKRRDVDSEKINEAWLQLSFGIGPHSHELE